MTWYEQVLSEAAKLAAGAGQWWVAIAIFLAGAVLVVVLRSLGPGAVAAIGAGLKRWHDMTPQDTTLNPDGSHKDGTGAPPMPVGEDGAVHLQQEPPKDYL